MKSTKILGLTLGCLALAGVSSAQQVISAKSGLVNYVQGAVLLNGKPVELKLGNFPTVSRESELRTEEGRAEVLLGPGVFLRLGESSAFKMASDRLSDTKVDFLTGSMIVQAADLSKDESVAITHKGTVISLVKNGVYRIDSEPARLMVYDGEARVENNGQTQSVKRSKQLMLNGVSVAEKFDNKTGDALYRWARRRDGDLAVANISAARSVGRYGNSYYGSGSGFGSTGWFFNPYFGSYTYLPMGGMYDSFWGYRYWSPVTVYSYYVPPVVSRGGGGGTNAGTVASTAHRTYSTAPSTSTGHSSSAARSAPPMAASSAGRTSVPRDSSAGRVSSGSMSGASMGGGSRGGSAPSASGRGR